MAYLLDTNACIQAINDGNSSVSKRILSTPASDIFMCTIVYFELAYGAYKSQRIEQNLAIVDRFFSQFVLLPLDRNSARIAGHIRANLEAKGTPIGSNDLLIAAIALAYNLVLVTHNIREFSRIKDLQYEDWEN